MKDLREAMELLKDYKAFARYARRNDINDLWYSRQNAIENYLRENQVWEPEFLGGPGNGVMLLAVTTPKERQSTRTLHRWMCDYIFYGSLPRDAFVEEEGVAEECSSIDRASGKMLPKRERGFFDGIVKRVAKLTYDKTDWM